jgi:hypothetical protein
LATKARSRHRSPEQKKRRKEAWLSRQGDRRAAAEQRFRLRYDELKAEMARHRQIIGPAADSKIQILSAGWKSPRPEFRYQEDFGRTASVRAERAQSTPANDSDARVRR